MFTLTIQKGVFLSFFGILFSLQIQASDLLGFRIQNISNKEYFLSWCIPATPEMLQFEVQSSSNGIDFEAIAQIEKGRLFDNCMYYSYTDANPFTGKSFYRIKISNSSTGCFFSKTETVSLITNAALNHHLQCWLEDQGLTFSFTSYNFDGMAHVTLYDYFGVELLSQSAIFSNKQRLSLSNLTTFPAGTYYLRLDTPKGTVVKKMILQ